MKSIPLLLLLFFVSCQNNSLDTKNDIGTKNLETLPAEYKNDHGVIRVEKIDDNSINVLLTVDGFPTEKIKVDYISRYSSDRTKLFANITGTLCAFYSSDSVLIVERISRSDRSDSVEYNGKWNAALADAFTRQ